MTAATGGGPEDAVVAAVELGERGVDPPRRNFDALAADGGDFFEAFFEGDGEVVLELGWAWTGALGDEVEVLGGEEDFGAVDDFREDPEAEGLFGILGSVADADSAVLEATELAEEDADHGAVGADRSFGASGLLDLFHDLAGERFVEEEEEESHFSEVSNRKSDTEGSRSQVEGQEQGIRRLALNSDEERPLTGWGRLILA